MTNRKEMNDLVNQISNRLEMTSQEKKTLEFCAIWSRIAPEVFPEYKHSVLKEKGDPRKSHLFRVCWKLARETRNMIKDDEYDLYIRANLEMLRVIHQSVGTVRIDPQILVGDKAWIRWKMWKRKFDQKDNARQIQGSEQLYASAFQVCQELQKTFDFLEKTFGGLWTQDQILEAKDQGTLKTWLSLQKVSPYYVLLSPFCRRACGGVKGIANYFDKVDFVVYRNDLNQEVLDLATKILFHEFQICEKKS